ncbi:uncharacterized protein LOC134432905 [Melospiza melodia melodia]|uniref:uncharacterized protein LOC134432905 n=1 Tax=Melospiza melodia melodia TaxID=1914991 RepID=UPI002FD0F449
MEAKELSPALLQPQVTVVAILGELLDTMPRWDEVPLKSLEYLYSKLVDFSRKLRDTTESIYDTWWHRDVTSNNKARLASLSGALAAYENTPWTSWDCVKMVARHWLGSADKCLENSTELGRKATELLNTCRDLATEEATEEATATARAREQLGLAARDGTAQERMVELGQALGREEEAKVVSGHGDQVRREARVAASEATRATMERQRLEVSLELVERLVTACDKATAFPRELKRRVGDIVATLEGTNEVSPDVPKDLVAKVAVAEQLWEANACLVHDHLVGPVDDITKCLFTGGPTSPSAFGVAERCQRAIEDIPRLLRPPECPRIFPKLSPVSMEPQKLSLALLKHNIAKPFQHCCCDSDLADAPTSLCPALAAYENIPWTTWGEKGPGDNGGQRVAQVGVHVGGQLDPADQRGHQAPGRLQGHGQRQGHHHGHGRSLKKGHRKGLEGGHKRRCHRCGTGCGRGCGGQEPGEGSQNDETAGGGAPGAAEAPGDCI